MVINNLPFFVSNNQVPFFKKMPMKAQKIILTILLDYMIVLQKETLKKQPYRALFF